MMCGVTSLFPNDYSRQEITIGHFICLAALAALSLLLFLHSLSILREVFPARKSDELSENFHF